MLATSERKESDMGTAANVRVGVNGAVAFADLGTTLPTTALEALGVAWTDVGYVSEDGVTQGLAADQEEIKAWGGDVVRKVQTSHDLTYALKLIETTEATLTLYYGDPDQITSDELPRRSWILDVLDGDQVVRICLPDAQITERGDVVYSGSEAVGYEVTLTAYPDDAGVKAYLYRDTESV
jgi:hypothetical protein